jgi:hypothetical protein
MNYSRYLHFRLDFTQAAFRKVPRFPFSVPHFHFGATGWKSFAPHGACQDLWRRVPSATPNEPWHTGAAAPGQVEFFSGNVGTVGWDFTKWDFQWDLPNGIFLWKVFFNEILGDSIGFGIWTVSIIDFTKFLGCPTSLVLAGTYRSMLIFEWIQLLGNRYRKVWGHLCY